MDSATILVLLLGAGVVALLVWFEVNSRRNNASDKQRLTPDQFGMKSLHKEGQIKVESETQKKKAA
ncbi:MAG TPA: hypothetical protein VKQ11_14540 [Candidatus Sulfotelmatobacter sp.]|nr:hypothetical protein [Candidatus Sulfotelmatobacter sp.]